MTLTADEVRVVLAALDRGAGRELIPGAVPLLQSAIAGSISTVKVTRPTAPLIASAIAGAIEAGVYNNGSTEIAADLWDRLMRYAG